VNMSRAKSLATFLFFFSISTSFENLWACGLPLKNIDSSADNLRWEGEYGCLYNYDNIKKCDWSLEREDIQEFSIGPRDFRVETWLQSHLTGSGSGRIIVIYQCNGEVLRQVFNQGIPGLRQMPIIEDGRIRLKLLSRKPEDPMCCPSETSEKILSWDRGKETFIE